MNDKQMNTQKQRLLTRREELLADIREELTRADESHFVDLAGRVHDSGEEAVADLLVDTDLAIVHQHIDEIRAIEKALLRIAEGSYASCEACGEPVGTQRLEVQPTATRCLACQQRFEQASQQSGHSL